MPDTTLVLDTPPQVAPTEPAKPATPSTEEQFNNSAEAFRNLFTKKDKEKEPKDEKKPEAKDGKPEKEPEKKDKADPAGGKPEGDGADGKKVPETAGKTDKPEAGEDDPDTKRVRRTGRAVKTERQRSDEITRTAAETAAATVAKMSEQKTADKPKEAPTDEIDLKDLPRDIALEMRVLGELETLDDRHKGGKAKLTTWIKKLSSYQSKWEDEHPGERFNAADEEHNAIYDAKPNIDPDDFEMGRVSIANKRLKNPKLEELEQENKKLKADFTEQKLTPIIANETNRAVHHILKSIDPSYTKYAESMEALAKLPEEDPIAADIMGKAVEPMIPFTQEVIRLWDGADVYKFNKDNATHQEILKFATDLEKDLLSKPESKTTQDGKAFASMADWEKMSKEERADHWSLAEKQNLLNFRLSQAIHEAHGLMEKEKKKAAAYERRFGKKEEPKAEAAPEKEDPKLEKKPAAKESEPPPPGSPGRSAVDTAPTTKKADPKDFNDRWLNRMLGS